MIRGARILGEVRTLMQDLRALDFDVLIESASNRWTIESFGKRFGVTADRVIGNALEVDTNGVLGPALIPPSLFRHGKVEAIARDIGTMPSLVFGDSVTDYEMMVQATELAVLIDSGDSFMLEEARRRGWAIQPQGELTSLRH